MIVKSVTQHALDRYMERSGVKGVQRALNKIMGHVEFAIPMGGHRFYSNGWVIVIKKRVVRTMYKPLPKDFLAIHNATLAKKSGDAQP